MCVDTTLFPLQGCPHLALSLMPLRACTLEVAPQRSTCILCEPLSNKPQKQGSLLSTNHNGTILVIMQIHACLSRGGEESTGGDEELRVISGEGILFEPRQFQLWRAQIGCKSINKEQTNMVGGGQRNAAFIWRTHADKAADSSAAKCWCVVQRQLLNQRASEVIVINSLIANKE